MYELELLRRIATMLTQRQDLGLGGEWEWRRQFEENYGHSVFCYDWHEYAKVWNNNNNNRRNNKIYDNKIKVTMIIVHKTRIIKKQLSI